MKVMGILNITPDSFYDGGQYNTTKTALKQATKMIKDGADIIDIGAESSRPNAKAVSENIEQQKIIPVIKAVRKKFPKILISVDTYKPETAKKALEAGADIVNDITGLKNAKMMQLIKDTNASVIIMHMRGTPETMQQMTDYKNVTKEIFAFFKNKISDCKKLGIDTDKIIIDPGIGFAKTKEKNFELLKNLKTFEKLKKTILIGTSRKSFLGSTPEKRLYGSLASVCHSYLRGARIFRVHDVKETKEVLEIMEKIENA
ncbi:MAG: dihydropteroate synthase [Elusimicrobiaceae bacterium]|nr:dihydropteroate synthase [Elusimicrobiaceae bacterium]